MPKIIPVEVQRRILEDLRNGYSNKEAAERNGTCVGYVCRLKRKNLAENKEPKEGKSEPAARHFEFYRAGGNMEQAVVEFDEPFETAEKYWEQWRTSNEDEFRRELEKKDAENRELREANFILREANERLRRRLAEYEKRLSSFGTFREMVLLRAMVDMIG